MKYVRSIAIPFFLAAFYIHIYAYGIVALPTPTPSSAPSPDANLAFEGTLIAAIIAAIVGILGIAFGIFQFFKSRKDEREKQRVQQQNEDLQHRLNIAVQRQQFEDELEKSRYEDFLATRRETVERERERKASMQAAARAVMIQARTVDERTAAYRKALHADTDIAHLQILDMAYPMEVTKVYVRLRLHQESQLRYDIDRAVLAAEERGDPNALIKARYALLETRSQAAMTPEEALQKYARCIILGDPGAGKSTLLKYLTLQSADQQLPHVPDLPVHIVLGDFATSPHLDLLRFAAERWDERYGFPADEAQQYIESRLSDGSAILLLDALDETVIGGNDEIARESYARVLAAINQVAVRYSKAPIVVTARKAGYHQRAHLSGFTELEVLDFRPQESEEFVTNWFKYHPAPPKNATASDLNAQLKRNSRVQSLASNPLLLSLIIMVYETRQELPERRAEIYSQCIDVLLFRWDTSRDIRRRRKFKAEQKQELLTEIAWYFHMRGRRYFPEDELLQVIAKFLPTIELLPEDSKGILREIEEENGLLKEQAHGWHGFLHLTLQEYFAAQYLSNAEHGLAELLKHCGDPWWEEVMLLYAGIIGDASPLLQALLRMEKKRWLWEDIFHTPLLWAGQCLAAKPRHVQKELRDEIIKRSFHVIRKTPYDPTREHLMETLLNIDSSDAKGRLLIMLKDKQEKINVRRQVAQALGRLGDHTVIPALLAILNDKHDESYVRWTIAQALGQLGDHTVIPDLLAILNDKHDDNTVRIYVAQVLGQLAAPSVISDLLAILHDKQDNSDLRRNVAEALGRLADPSVVPELLAILHDKQDNSDLRRNVAEALGRLADPSVVPELLAILHDKQDDSFLRGSVALALGRLADPSVVPELLAILHDKQDDSFSFLRWGAALALVELADPSLIPELLAILHDKQEGSPLRGSVAAALGELANPSVILELLAILHDKYDDSDVRWDVALALIKMGQREAVFPYLSFLLKKIEPYQITSKFVWDYASLRIVVRVLRSKILEEDYLQSILWEAAQREKVRIMVFSFWGIKLVRVVR